MQVYKPILYSYYAKICKYRTTKMLYLVENKLNCGYIWQSINFDLEKTCKFVEILDLLVT